MERDGIPPRLSKLLTFNQNTIMPKAPSITTGGETSTDVETPRTPDSPDQSESKTQSDNVGETGENGLILPLDKNGDLEPRFIIKVENEHPKAFSAKGWKETQLAVMGHKGMLSDSEKALVDRVFKKLQEHSKRESLGLVTDSDHAQVRKNLRVFNDIEHTAQRIADIRTIKDIEYSS